jgi:hypothetical protein
MRTCFFAGFLLLILSLSASAVNVSVSVNDSSVFVGESVLLHLEVNTSEPVGGQFVLYEETEPKKYVLVRVYADFPDCAACGGQLPLSRPHSADYLFKPLSTGSYMAEAAFGGVIDRVFFNVSRKTTPRTSTTAASTSSSTTTTSTSETTSSSSSSSSTTTISETSTTAASLPSSASSDGDYFLYAGLLLPLAVVFLLVFSRRK